MNEIGENIEMIPYINRIDFRYKYSQNKAMSAVVALRTISKYKKYIQPNNGIIILNDTGGQDRFNYLKKYQYLSYFDLQTTRSILANIFANHKDKLEEIMERGFNYGTIENRHGHITVAFLEERNYIL
jgi:hypothetical protein